MIGWECPKCGRCYAPFVQACNICGPTDTRPEPPPCPANIRSGTMLPFCFTHNRIYFPGERCPVCDGKVTA